MSNKGREDYELRKTNTVLIYFQDNKRIHFMHNARNENWSTRAIC